MVPNFINIPNTRITKSEWIGIVGPGGGQKFWSEGHPVVETLFDYGVSSIFSLDLKFRCDYRTPNQASTEIVEELIALLTPTAPNKVIVTGYSTGGMILLKSFHDGGTRLRSLIHEDSIFNMIGVSLRFLDPATENIIHNFWTVESSRNDPTRLQFLEKSHGDAWPNVVCNCGKWMLRYSGLFLEVNQIAQFLELYPRLFFVTGDNDSLIDNTPFFNEIECAIRFFTIPNTNHFSYFSSEVWPVTRSVYLLVLQLYIRNAKL